MSAGWANWSGAVHCRTEPEVPEDLDALRDAVCSTPSGVALRCVGSGHSFVPFWGGEDRLLSLERFTGVEGVDGAVARIRAGTPLHALGPLLAAQGRALINQGDIDRQTLAGAVATGTHGTGRGLGSLSSAVRAVELVDGEGELRRLADGEEVAAARVSLGLLGVMTVIELETTERYGLHERNHLEPIDATLEALASRIDGHRHHEFWWVPRGDSAIAKTLDVIDEPAAPQLDEIPFGEAGERWGTSWQVFPSDRSAKFNEMEYAVPSSRGPGCFRALRAALLEHFPALPWPVEYRIVAGDDGWLSPTAGEEVAAISVHQDARRDPAPLFALAEAIFVEHGGRPHWGKQQHLDAALLAARYPRLPAFRALAQQYDPRGRFVTDWLRERLGF